MECMSSCTLELSTVFTAESFNLILLDRVNLGLLNLVLLGDDYIVHFFSSSQPATSS